MRWNIVYAPTTDPDACETSGGTVARASNAQRRDRGGMECLFGPRAWGAPDPSRQWSAEAGGYTAAPMTRRLLPPTTSRRDFIAATALGAVGVVGVGGCSKKAKSSGAASNAKQTAEVLPKLIPKRFLNPDIPGEGPIPDGYLSYPRELVVAVKRKPGSTGRPITTMNASWGATPPGVERNSYLQAVNAELGVPIHPSAQDGNTYAAKLSAILGARDVPDLLSVPNWEVDKIPRFSQAVKALFEDLTDHLRGDAVG